MKVKFEGGRALDQALGELKKATAQRAVREALIEAGTPIQAQAQEQARARPASSPKKFFKKGGARKLRRTGTLKALFQIGTRLTRGQAALVRQAGKDFVEVYVGSRDPAALLEEFGTKDSPPNPVLRRSWEAHKDDALETIRAALTRNVAHWTAKAQAKAARDARRAARQQRTS